MDEREQTLMVARIATAQEALMAHLESLDRDTGADAAVPSELPGWSRGHLLTHIARNADGLRRVLEGVDRGEHLEQYPGGVAARNADIETGADRSWSELVEDVRSSGSAFVDQVSKQQDWDGYGFNVRGDQHPAVNLPFARWREVTVHHADLGDSGYTVDDWPLDYVREELRRQTMLWDSRRPMGATGLPAAALAAPERLRLLWLLGRAHIEGVESNRGL